MKPRVRVALFSVLTLVLCLVILEASSWVLLKFSNFQTDSFASEYEKAELQATSASPWALRMKGHPFFGFVCDDSFRHRACNNHGFDTRHNFPYQKKPNEVVVGVFGGSVAIGVGIVMEAHNDLFSEYLTKQVPRLKGKRLVFINFALGGYRQPQQYFIASYFSEMLDMAVFLDGANEMGANPYPMFPLNYPKLAPRFFSDSSDDFLKKKAIHVLRKVSASMTLTANRSWLLRQSAFYFLTWNLYNRFSEKAVTELGDEMVNVSRESRSRFFPEPLEEKQIDLELAQNWEKYTSMSYQLLKIYKIPSFFFAQPSQYVPNSKIFSDEEADIAFKKDPIKRKKSEDKMLLLQSSVRKLKTDGVPVWDFTDLFRKETQPIYIDDFCHINQAGREILIRAMLDAMATKL